MHAVAGIGHPERFFRHLEDMGIRVNAHPFPDHHRFADAEIARLRHEAERADARLVTTAKDWVRLPVRLRGGIEVLEVRVRWHDATAVTQLVANVLAKPAAGRAIG